MGNGKLHLATQNKTTNNSPNIYGLAPFGNQLDEKRAECTEHFFKLIADFSDVWVYWINADSTLGYNSPACKYITGYDLTDELFSDIHFLEKLIHPLYFKNLKKYNEFVESGLNISHADFSIITKTGQIKWIHHYCQTVYDREGKYIGIYAANTDITEMKKLKELFLFNQSIVQSIPDNDSNGYYQIYFDGTLKSANQTFLRMLGYNSIDDLSGFNIEEHCLLSPDSRNDFKNELLKHGFVKEYEFKWIRKDWTIVYLKETASIIESMSWDKPYYQGMVEDITERKLIELANSEAHSNRIKTELLKTEFLATISHEIRTPLNAILNFTQMLKGEDAATVVNEKNEAIDIIVTEGERIKRTIDLILELSQLQSDTYEYIYTEMDLFDDVLIPVFKIYEPRATKKNLRFNVNRLLTNAKITVDKQSVIQIFTQLLDNAVKFTSVGRIDVSIYQNIIGQICVEISDTGKGIREEYIPHLFSLFSQEENSYSRTFEGIGVGLAIIKKHCSQNNIRVDVDSKKNVGTKFIITFMGNTPSEDEEIFY